MGTPRARLAAAGAIAAVVAWLAFYTGWLLLAPGGGHALLVFADTAYLVPIAAAVLLSAWAATRVPPGLRIFWLLVSLACASWLAGEALWSVSELRDGSVPFPWWTDVAYFGFYGVIFVALVWFFRPSLRVIGGQALLDGLLALASLGLLWWWLVLQDLELGADLASVVGLAYPVLDLVLLCTIVTTPLVSARRGTLAGWLVAAGVAAGGIADGLYTHHVLQNGYASGGLIDLGWQVQACLICLAAVASALGIGRKPNWAQRRSPMRVRTAAGMTASLLVILLVLGVEGARGEPSSHAIAFVFVVTALLVIRGWILLISTARESARRDPLTGVYDEPHLHDQLRRLAAAARQYDEAFALVLLRVPRRTASDALGRLVGTARELDLVARLDDGRLAVVLARTSEEGAAEAAERLRLGAGTAAAAGVAVWRRGDTAADVAARAETLLDAATQLGGNHTRGPKADVLLNGHPRLGVTAFGQLLELATAIDARYLNAPVHSRKVAALSRDLALALELEPDAVAASYLGGLLHALGTLSLDEAALHPHGPLTALDAKLELHHGTRGADLVSRIPCAAHVARIVAAYEEHWDGTGPRRVRGESIPFEARVVSVANAIVTMTEPGGDALPLTSSLTEIWRLAGGRYDPEVVSALFRVVRDGGVAELLEEHRPDGAVSLTPA
jgi:HD-GYP domain-containing protein (c-di-GMP phosphodiesterase class II)